MVDKIPMDMFKCLVLNGYDNPANRSCYSGGCEYHDKCRELYNEMSKEETEDIALADFFVDIHRCQNCGEIVVEEPVAIRVRTMPIILCEICGNAYKT